MIYIASDHGGFALKKVILNYLKKKKIRYEDLGTNSLESVDYPDIAQKLCKKVLESKSKGILICGAGIGMGIAANRFKGIRAAVCTNEYMARMAIRHNNANVLCLGARVLGDEIAKEIVDAFLSSKFEAGRHKRRVLKLDKID